MEEIIKDFKDICAVLIEHKEKDKMIEMKSTVG